MAASLPDPARTASRWRSCCCLAACAGGGGRRRRCRKPTKDPIDLVAASSDFDYKQNRLHFQQVRITQGPMQVEAREASATGLNFENSEWTFTGDVRITVPDGKLDGVERRGDVPQQGDRERRDQRIAGGVRAEAEGQPADRQGPRQHDRVRREGRHRAPHRRRVADRRRQRDPGRHADLRRRQAARRGQPGRQSPGRRAHHDQSEGPDRSPATRARTSRRRTKPDTPQ